LAYDEYGVRSLQNGDVDSSVAKGWLLSNNKQIEQSETVIITNLAAFTSIFSKPNVATNYGKPQPASSFWLFRSKT
jgi:hypothetical protein